MKHYPHIGKRTAAVLVAGAYALSVTAVQASAMSAPRPLHNAPGAVSVSVAVPPLVTGGSDGLPSTLAAGKSYVVVVVGVATSGTGGATMSVTASGASLASCTAKLAEVKPYTVKCALRVNPSAKQVIVDVAAKGKGFSAKYASFTHKAR